MVALVGEGKPPSFFEMLRVGWQAERRRRARERRRQELLDAGLALLDGDVESARRAAPMAWELPVLLWFAEATKTGWRCWRVLCDQDPGPLQQFDSLRLLSTADRFGDFDWAWDHVAAQGVEEPGEPELAASVRADVLRHAALRAGRVDLAASVASPTKADPWNQLSEAYVAMARSDRAPAWRTLRLFRDGLPTEHDPNEFAPVAADELEAVLEGRPALETALEVAARGCWLVWAQLPPLRPPGEDSGLRRRWQVRARVGDAVAMRRLPHHDIGGGELCADFESASARAVVDAITRWADDQLLTLTVEGHPTNAPPGPATLLGRTSQCRYWGVARSKMLSSVDMTGGFELQHALGDLPEGLRRTLRGFHEGQAAPSVI